MASTTNEQWYWDREKLAAALAQHGSRNAITDATGVNPQTLQHWIRKHGLASGHPRSPGGGSQNHPASKAIPPRAKITDDTALLIGAPNPMATNSLSPDDLFRAHNLDPQDWEYTTTINRWDALAGDGKVTTLAQLKINAKRKRSLDLIVPARAAGWRPTRLPQRKAPRRAVWRELVTSDAHAPYHDTGKHRAFCRLLADVKPDGLTDLGDMLDLPRPSRHRPTPGWSASPQECVDASHRLWAERVAASPRTRRRALLGNHDDRLRMAAEERIPDFHDLRPPGNELSPFDVGHLLRFDELGVELIRPAGEYHAAEVVIAEGVPGKPWTRLVGIHGTQAGAKGQPGAGKAADRRTCSVLQGHDHRQGLTYLSRWDGERRVGDVAAVSIGTSSTRDGGIGYAVDPDWQQGDAMVTIWPDGHWHVELIRWDGGELTWRDNRYSGADVAA